jgi:hypothetical protein
MLYVIFARVVNTIDPDKAKARDPNMISNHPRPLFKATLYKLNHNFVMKNGDGNRKIEGTE